jgi:hypothetical protein
MTCNKCNCNGVYYIYPLCYITPFCNVTVMALQMLQSQKREKPDVSGNSPAQEKNRRLICQS